MSVFTYTYDDLKLLRECLRCNDNLISRGLPTFLETAKRGEWRQFLEFAEEITHDDQFPEIHFGLYVPFDPRKK